MTIATVLRPPDEVLSVRDRGRRAALRTAFGNLSLSRKVALIPALTLLLMGLMLAVGERMAGQNTIALHTLDHDVFEPLNEALTLKDGITLLHTRLFALLSLGTNQADPVAQQAAAQALLARLDTEAGKFRGFLDATGAVPPSVAVRLREEFTIYAGHVRETADFAAYDASYGALLAGPADENFSRLSADLDALVQALEQRRESLVAQAVLDSREARRLLLGLGLCAAVLALLGSVVVGRSIAQPVFRLTALMNRLAGGDTDLAVPGTERSEEVGAMARAVEVFRANAIARRQGEADLLRTNMLLDTALNSMLQGLVVWGPDHRVRLVNGRFFAIFNMPDGCVGPGMTAGEVAAVSVRHGLHPGDDPKEVANIITASLTARRSSQSEMEIRPGQFARIASEPTPDGGAVVTFEDVTDKRRNEQQIAFLAHHDALTGLPNRLLFQEHMAAAADARLDDGVDFGVLCLDLDHFKEVNDTLGHGAGDELLRMVSERLRHCVRDGDTVARLGGDEFAIVLSGTSGGATAAIPLAKRLVDAIGAPFNLQGQSVFIGTSIGIALAEPGVPIADLLKRADVALYRAKEERGTFALFEPGMDERLHARRGIEAELRLAIERDQFELHYQPLYNFAEQRITGFEALLRWNTPIWGRVSPADFIPMAEQTGLIAPIGEWVLRTACARAADWPDHVRVAVNLSPVQFKNKRLVTMVRDILEQSGLPARRLELEITETVLLRDTEAVMTILNGLHGLGVRVSMDDFGTGYSSLSYLRRFPFDKIKIDQSFVRDLSIAPNPGEGAAGTQETLSEAARSAAVIVRAIVGIGHNLGISTTAEGVETAHQFAQIRQEGCNEAQGYFISPPRPEAEIDALRQMLDTTLPVLAGGRGAAPQRIA